MNDIKGFVLSHYKFFLDLSSGNAVKRRTIKGYIRFIVKSKWNWLLLLKIYENK